MASYSNHMDQKNFSKNNFKLMVDLEKHLSYQ